MRDSPVMADKPKFFLAPSRLGRPAGTDDSQTAKPKFTGLTTTIEAAILFNLCIYRAEREQVGSFSRVQTFLKCSFSDQL